MNIYLILQTFIWWERINSVKNKKPQHPAGVSHIGLLGMTPVLPHAPGAIFLILVVWSILLSMTSSQENSSMSHSSKGPKLMWAKAYKVPEIYPQEMGIISNIHALIKFKKSQNWLLFKQNYWQELSKMIIKKPTCFQVGFSGLRPRFFIA